MRNVTNKQAADPNPPMPKRGRGRPRKPDAMTNAQRQAAYRQRQRATQINVTVTEKDDPARQLPSSHAALLEARDAQAQLSRQLARAEAELRDRKTARAGKESGPGFEVMLCLLAMACARKPLKAQLVIRESDVWRDGVVRASGVSEEQMKRVAAALAGKLT
jgi:hypothetical protein